MILAALIVLIIAGVVIAICGWNATDDTLGGVGFAFGIATAILGIIALVFHATWFAKDMVPWL